MRIEMSCPEGSQQPESEERVKKEREGERGVERDLMMMTGEESRTGEITAGLG